MPRHSYRRIITLVLIIGWHNSILATTLSGYVLEESTALPDVEVMLVKTDSGVIVNRDYTDKNGVFQFTVEPGIYDVGAFKFDYATVWNRDITVQQDNTSIEIRLEPAAFSEESAPSADDCE
ncbi:carboxypeptidase-like regulatory domain-containing protein [Candidatus Thiodiazotropha sp. LNASS1]|uniref:carboxypeptidase-like regulatory domain-containing protein n=1 Tax=Candidatus Thiodiazotropha sp. LNASS1 TaxID=3096260 RepID=UPI0034DFECAD